MKSAIAQRTSFDRARGARLVFSASEIALKRPAAARHALRVAARFSPVHWVEPKLVAEITYLTWTADNLLRQTVYVRLWEDKQPSDVRRE